jgi:hypothetical protein
MFRKELINVSIEATILKSYLTANINMTDVPSLRMYV